MVTSSIGNIRLWLICSMGTSQPRTFLLRLIHFMETFITRNISIITRVILDQNYLLWLICFMEIFLIKNILATTHMLYQNIPLRTSRLTYMFFVNAIDLRCCSTQITPKVAAHAHVTARIATISLSLVFLYSIIVAWLNHPSDRFYWSLPAASYQFYCKGSEAGEPMEQPGLSIKTHEEESRAERRRTAARSENKLHEILKSLRLTRKFKRFNWNKVMANSLGNLERYLRAHLGRLFYVLASVLNR